VPEFLAGRNVTTRRALIGISRRSSVTAGRWFLLRRSKLPKPDSFTCSPAASDARNSRRKIHELAGLSLVEAELIEQCFRDFCLRQCHLYLSRIVALCSAPGLQRLRHDGICLSSVRVREYPVNSSLLRRS